MKLLPHTALLLVFLLASAAQATDLPAPGVITQASPGEPAQPVAPEEDDELNIVIPTVEAAPVDDPWEGFNRPVFGFNKAADSYVLKPVASGYHWIFPETVREGVGNFFQNLGEPVNFINGVLQLDPQKAFSSFWRFLINSTFGVAGLYDFAGHVAHLPPHKNSFGDTLDSYGVESGPYLMVPLLGPSNPRDAVGGVVDFAMNPFTYITLTPIDTELTVLEVIDLRDQNAVLLDEMYGNALEPYIAMRSAYLQNKTFTSRDGTTKKLDE
ncbi:MAG: VacJ family lipoprotein [Pseudomonadota bacterium]